MISPGTTSQAIGARINSSQAISLIELVLVILLVTILSVVAVPKITDILTFSSRGYSSEVLSSIRYAQKLAISMGCEVQVSLTATTLTLNLRQNCTTGDFNQNINDPALGANNFVKNAPRDVAIASTDFPIYFDRMGRAHDSISGNLINASLTVNTTQIFIVGETGFAYAQ